MATLIPIERSDDPRLADYVGLREASLRRLLETEQGIFIAEGQKVIRRALEAGYPARSLLLAERWLADLQELIEPLEIPVYLVSEALAEAVTGFHVHRGALGSMYRRPLASLPSLLGLPQPGEFGAEGAHSGPPERGVRRARIAVLEDLVDHTNVGAAFRSAAALGVDAVLVTPHCADPLYRRSIKVSMGAVFQVPWTRVESWPGDIELIKQAGYVVAGMTLGEGAISLDELVAEDHQRLALIFGSEGPGLLPMTDRLVDRRVRIPMMGGVDSLNVAACSAVAFYATR